MLLFCDNYSHLITFIIQLYDLLSEYIFSRKIIESTLVLNVARYWAGNGGGTITLDFVKKRREKNGTAEHRRIENVENIYADRCE